MNLSSMSCEIVTVKVTETLINSLSEEFCSYINY